MSVVRHLRLKTNTILRVLFQGGWYYLMLLTSLGKKASINRFERRIYSQNGEDGILQYIFHKIGATNKFFVEVGAGDGIQCNTRFLKRLGWEGLQIDAYEQGDIKKHFVSTENVETILKRYKVPFDLDLLSIDIDGNDYWIWQAIVSYKPRVVMIEYNAMLGDKKSLVMPYNKRHNWNGSDYFGASLSALARLAKKKGYVLVGTNKTGVNAFFVERSLAGKHFLNGEVRQFYHAPGYALYPRSLKKFVKG
jgi:hypothetical protein